MADVIRSTGGHGTPRTRPRLIDLTQQVLGDEDFFVDETAGVPRVLLVVHLLLVGVFVVQSSDCVGCNSQPIGRLGQESDVDCVDVVSHAAFFFRAVVTVLTDVNQVEVDQSVGIRWFQPRDLIVQRFGLTVHVVGMFDGNGEAYVSHQITCG